MALQTLPSVMAWPRLIGPGNTGETNRGDLDAAGEYNAIIFSAPQDMTISHFAYSPYTVTGSPTVDLRIETVSAAGLPSGTLWATDTNAVVSPGGILQWTLGALTASASITKGQMVCAKLAYASGTAASTVYFPGHGNTSTGTLPKFVRNTGADTVDASSYALAWALGSSSTTFYNIPGLIPAIENNLSSFNNTNGARKGNRFQVPFTCRCVGLWAALGGSTGDFNYALYDDAGSELSSSSTAMDGNHPSTDSGACMLFFDNAVTLSPATWYRAVLEPSSATNITMTGLHLSSADYRSGSPWGTNCHQTTYASAAWTDTATDRQFNVGLLIDQLDDGAGAGGGSFTFA
jgi:hypothetical protein